MIMWNTRFLFWPLFMTFGGPLLWHVEENERSWMWPPAKIFGFPQQVFELSSLTQCVKGPFFVQKLQSLEYVVWKFLFLCQNWLFLEVKKSPKLVKKLSFHHGFIWAILDQNRDFWPKNSNIWYILGSKIQEYYWILAQKFKVTWFARFFQNSIFGLLYITSRLTAPNVGFDSWFNAFQYHSKSMIRQDGWCDGWFSALAVWWF